MTSRFAVGKALVTGGAQGIGAAIGRRLAEEGMSVALVDRNEQGALATAAAIGEATGSRVFGYGADVTDAAGLGATVGKAAAEMGGLDCYIGNAGITRDKAFHKLTDEDWDAVIAVNLTGVFNGLRACAPWLRAPGPGRVVLISSVVAKAGNFGQMNYIAAKAGVVGLVRSGASELARAGTTVNGIRPGFIETDMTAAMPEEAQAAMRAASPLGRAGTPADIAGAVAFLCSEDASFVTGHILDVNGGMAF
ncbi:SDR family oxidoreductase [Nakamurella alba]|nr:SDR family oxidoreductase [Nakamurella alba]